MTSKQPNSRMCFVCGLENDRGLKLSFYNSAEGEVTAEVTVPPAFQGYPGVVHGGIVAAMLDEAGGRTSMIDDPDHFMMTVKLEVKYRAPVPIGVPLKVIGRRVKTRGRLATARACIRLPDGSGVAEADLTLADLPPKLLEDLPPTDQLGWRVYPDADRG